MITTPKVRNGAKRLQAESAHATVDPAVSHVPRPAAETLPTIYSTTAPEARCTRMVSSAPIRDTKVQPRVVALYEYPLDHLQERVQTRRSLQAGVGACWWDVPCDPTRPII